ncbi:MAG: porin [Bacteroidia bacterium]|nr:porin [Bacteroidia bacterium]
MRFSAQYAAVLLLAMLVSAAGYSQGSETYKTGLKVNLNEDGSRYFRFIVWNQMWTRYIQNNPGTASAAGTEQKSTVDIGLRRARILAYAQLSPRYLILTHIGINNQTFTNGGAPFGGLSGNPGSLSGSGSVTGTADTLTGAVTGTASVSVNGASSKKPQVFFHDFWNEFLVAKGKQANLSVGFGLHYWNPVSRLTSASTLNFLAVDAPIFNWFNIELTDQFARQFGIYAKGKVSKLDYRLHLNKPFNVNQVSGTGAISRAVHAANDKLSYGGYLNWQFLDQESNLLPFFVGSYVGTKKVFNLGAGFYYHADALATRTDNGGPLSYHDQSQLALDAFLDMPFGNKEKNMAVTAYAVYYNMNFGPNYYRSVGIMNVAPAAPYAGFNTADRSIDGYGNARPLLGTGNIFYTQAGLLLPKTISKKVRIQPFAAYTMKDLDYLSKSASFFDIGSNFYIDGHHAKFTLQWSQRPVITQNAQGERLPTSSRGELIFQTHIYL